MLGALGTLEADGDGGATQRRAYSDIFKEKDIF